MLHDNHQRRQQPCNLHPGQTRVNFFTGRGGDGHDSPILDDCFEKALFFIDFIDEKRPYQPSQASYYGKYLKMIFFSYFHLWLYISIWEITRIPSARLHQYTLPHWIFPDFAETAAATPPALINDEIHLPYCSAPGWFSHCNSVFSIHQCRMSRTPPLPCPMIRKIISGSFGESGLKLPQGPEGPQRGKTRTSHLPQNRRSAGQSP